MDRKTILIVIVALAIGVFAGMQYQSRCETKTSQQVSVSDTTTVSGQSCCALKNKKDSAQAKKECCTKSVASTGQACCATSKKATN